MVEFKILLVSGSRTIKDMIYVWNILQDIHLNVFIFDTIVEGGAKGVDEDAGLFARKHKFNHFTIFPKWNMYGKGAGKLRTNDMVEICNKGIAIWDGKSKGTEHAITELKKAGKLLKIFNYEVKNNEKKTEKSS